MELRALLFTADGSSAATLCQILTELGIQAEICSEVLVAAERISREAYDAIVVDWDQQIEAGSLLKKAREQRVPSLNLALVPDDAAISRALQQGANSVIKKPIEMAHASDTLTTARDLILSRRTEQQEKQARLEALAAEAENEPLEDAPSEPPQAAKSGFLSQAATPATALEAEQRVAPPPQAAAAPGWQAARGPSTIRDSREAESRPAEALPSKRWDEVRTIFQSAPEATKESAAEAESNPDLEPAYIRTQDSTGVFSSASEDPQEETPAAEGAGSSAPQYLVFAVVACVLIAGVLYVWAPGDSYLGRVNSVFHAFSVKARASVEKPVPAAASNPTGPPPAPAAATQPEEALMADPPAESTDVDPSKIQIIETKTIPKAGAQQPPNIDPPPDSDQAKALAQANAEGTSPALPPATQVDGKASDAPTLPTPPPAPMPVATTAPAPAPNRVREDTMPSPEARTGVIIPDSLRSTPAPSPASNLEPSFVPEATARGLLISRVEPPYPAQALGQHLEGPVVLQAWVGKDGSVRDVKLVTGYLLLGRAAFDAVRQWRFRPLVQEGRAIEFQTSITLNFKCPQ